MNTKKTHCLRGHPFDEANTFLRKDGEGRGRRECITCRRMRWGAYEREGRVPKRRIRYKVDIAENKAIRDGRDIRPATEIAEVEAILHKMCAIIDIATRRKLPQ